MLADIPSALELLCCAADVQRQLAGQNGQRPPHQRMTRRIGLNLGDIVERHAALYGDAVNVAARIQALNKDLRAQMPVSGATRARLSSTVGLESMPAVRVNLRSTEVAVFALT